MSSPEGRKSTADLVELSTLTSLEEFLGVEDEEKPK